MDQQEFETYSGIVVPASALRREQQRTRYGTLADLPDEELADPAELERVMHKEMWGPILTLPRQRYERRIRPGFDEDGGVEWGAFGTVDFDRHREDFDRLRDGLMAEAEAVVREIEEAEIKRDIEDLIEKEVRSHRKIKQS